MVIRFTYHELVKAVGEAIGRPRRLVNVSPGMGCLLGKLLGWFMHDVFITRDEIRGLMSGPLHVNTPPTGKTALTAWMKQNAATLGLRYASELDRRRDRRSPYFAKES